MIFFRLEFQIDIETGHQAGFCACASLIGGLHSSMLLDIPDGWETTKRHQSLSHGQNQTARKKLHKYSLLPESSNSLNNSVLESSL